MIVENVSFAGGLHCETTTLGALLRHAGVELSEPMMFGLGEGLGFIYWDAKNMEFPFLGGRSKPATITRTVAERLGLTLDVRETSSPRKAWQNVADALDAGRRPGCSWTRTTWSTSPRRCTSAGTSWRSTATTTRTPTWSTPRSRAVP